MAGNSSLSLPAVTVKLSTSLRHLPRHIPDYPIRLRPNSSSQLLCVLRPRKATHDLILIPLFLHNTTSRPQTQYKAPWPLLHASPLLVARNCKLRGRVLRHRHRRRRRNQYCICEVWFGDLARSRRTTTRRSDRRGGFSGRTMWLTMRAWDGRRAKVCLVPTLCHPGEEY